MSIKVIIADDHQLIRQDFCSMLEKEKDIIVVMPAKSTVWWMKFRAVTKL